MIKDGDEIDPDELIIGAEVDIEIEDDMVVEIDVEDDQDIDVEGEIVRLYSNAIKIKQTSGYEFKFSFEDDASLEDERGRDIDIEDLETGMDVLLELSDGEISTLEVF